MADWINEKYRLVKRLKDVKDASPEPVLLDLIHTSEPGAGLAAVTEDLSTYPNLKGLALRAEMLGFWEKVKGLGQVESLQIEESGYRVNYNLYLPRNWEVLKRCFSHIRRLSFRSSFFAPGMLDPEQFPYLEQLIVNPGTVEDWNAFFEDLSGFRDLRALKLVLPAIRDNKDFRVENFPSEKFVGLKKLEVTGSVKQPPDFMPLSGLEVLGWEGYLTGVPSGLGDLGLLKKLRLSMGAKKFPNRLACGHRLEELQIGGNNITTLPAFLEHLPNLKKLSLVPGHIFHGAERLSDLKALEWIDISGLGNRQLHQELFRLKNLRQLIANNCKMQEIPASIGEIRGLKVLRLRDNDLEALPDTFARLKELTALDLSDNKLKELPEWLPQLPKLKKLTIGGNRIIWPGGIRLQKKLSKVIRELEWATWTAEERKAVIALLQGQSSGDLSKERLVRLVRSGIHPLKSNAYHELAKRIPNPFLGGLPETIHLMGHPEGYTLLETEQMCERLGIKVVDQDDAELHFMPLEMFYRFHDMLSQGEKICLGPHLNQLFREQLPGFLQTGVTEKQLERFESLLSAEIREARILGLTMMSKGGIPDGLITQMIGIVLFDWDMEVRRKALNLMERYHSETVRAVLGQYGRKDILLQGMPPKALSFWDFLMQAPEIDPEVFQKMAVLYKARIPPKHRAREFNSPDYFMKLVQNGWLRLEKLGLKKLPPGVTGVGRLEYLVLTANKLTDLPEEIGQLKNLKRLFLRGNRLERLPASIGELCELEVLDLSDNKLQGLPDAFRNLKNLNQLILSGNPELDWSHTWDLLLRLPKLTLLYVPREEVSPELAADLDRKGIRLV